RRRAVAARRAVADAVVLVRWRGVGGYPRRIDDAAVDDQTAVDVAARTDRVVGARARLTDRTRVAARVPAPLLARLGLWVADAPRDGRPALDVLGAGASRAAVARAAITRGRRRRATRGLVVEGFGERVPDGHVSAHARDAVRAAPLLADVGGVRVDRGG